MWAFPLSLKPHVHNDDVYGGLLFFPEYAGPTLYRPAITIKGQKTKGYSDSLTADERRKRRHMPSSL